ncbi:hypothetical protein CL659_02485 [bacterium]|nr:hypothetical protein [bacterium]|tara:strand:- start:21446 stop:21922 length:477 start_codon:yes stop_codon:yes gene_type:complete
MESSSNIALWQVQNLFSLLWLCFVFYRFSYVKKIQKDDFEKARRLEGPMRRCEIFLMTVVPVLASIILFFENPVFISYVITSSAIKIKLLVVIIAILIEAASLKFCTKISYEIENKIKGVEASKKNCLRCDFVLIPLILTVILVPISFTLEILNFYFS